MTFSTNRSLYEASTRVLRKQPPLRENFGGYRIEGDTAEATVFQNGKAVKVFHKGADPESETEIMNAKAAAQAWVNNQRKEKVTEAVDKADIDAVAQACNDAIGWLSKIHGNGYVDKAKNALENAMKKTRNLVSESVRRKRLKESEDHDEAKCLTNALGYANRALNSAVHLKDPALTSKLNSAIRNIKKAQKGENLAESTEAQIKIKNEILGYLDEPAVISQLRAAHLALGRMDPLDQELEFLVDALHTILAFVGVNREE